MYDSASTLGGSVIDSVFLGCAVLGGGVFIVRTLLQLIGIGAGDVIEGDMGDTDDVHPGSDSGFRVLSLQGIGAFLMMFGLVGLALVRQSGVSETLALVPAAAAALGSVWVIGRVFGMMGKLQSSGTMSIDNAIGQEGTVYLSITQGGVGKVELAVQGRLGVWDARTVDDAPLATGKRVKVVRVAAGDVMVVEALN